MLSLTQPSTSTLATVNRHLKRFYGKNLEAAAQNSVIASHLSPPRLALNVLKRLQSTSGAERMQVPWNLSLNIRSPKSFSSDLRSLINGCHLANFSNKTDSNTYPLLLILLGPSPVLIGVRCKCKHAHLCHLYSPLGDNLTTPKNVLTEHRQGTLSCYAILLSINYRKCV